jgi:hypothetical protein
MRSLLVLALAVTFVAAMAGSSKPKEYVCYRAAGKIVIDGKLDEPSWRDAPATDKFVDIEGDIRPHPRFTTRAKMLCDRVASARNVTEEKCASSLAALLNKRQ